MARRMRPAVALLDLKLPDGDGLDLFRSLRLELRALVGIIITGYGTPANAYDCYCAGIAGYLGKPLRMDTLVDLVEGRLADAEQATTPLFRDRRREAPSALAGILQQLSTETAPLVDNRPVRDDARLLLRTHLARAAADPSLTMHEFVAASEALRLLSSEEEPWSRRLLDRIQARLHLAARAEGNPIGETGRQLVDWLDGAGRAHLHSSTEAGACAFGMDPDAFSELLRRELGLTFRELRGLILMRRAVGMLATSNEQVAQIAYALGYEDPSPFNRRFEAEFGMSPGSYRRLILGR